MTRERIWHWSSAVALTLLAWGLRLCCLDTVPPGWRDDELINIHALSGELLAGRFPLYFTGASGHEPLYHYLHAGVHAVLGFNVLSGHLLSVALGVLSVALTYALTRRLFGRWPAFVASLALTVSFWSLMYSRTAIRHVILPPCALATFYLLWRALTEKPGFFRTTWLLTGLVMGLSLYTYPAARLLPAIFVALAAYLALFHRALFRRSWRGILVSLAIAAVLAAPLGGAIARGRSEAAAEGIGADARIAELAVPLRELRSGNPRPLIENTWTTLGMFHATGDPEWLYNIPNRPVFNSLGGILLWAGVALCVYRWRKPRYFFLILWFGLGLLPAFISTPPASLSHTILAQPVAYILPSLAVGRLGNLGIGRLVRARQSLNLSANLSTIVSCLLAILFLATNGIRDLHDYFAVWPQQDMVRFLYRADYRAAAHYLDAHPEISDVAVSGTLLGPWDRLALDVDTHRVNVAARFFDPRRALVWTGDASSSVLLTDFPVPTAPIYTFLNAGAAPEVVAPRLRLYTLQVPNPQSLIPDSRFANGLELVGASWAGQDVLTLWRVATPLDLPSIPVVANPPPPGVYSGLRLAVFAHLLGADGEFVAGDDGLWVDPLTLRPGDCFVQVHHFESEVVDGSHTVELGLYDPMTGKRWAVLDPAGRPLADRVLVPDVDKAGAP